MTSGCILEHILSEIGYVGSADFEFEIRYVFDGRLRPYGDVQTGIICNNGELELIIFLYN